MVSEAAGVKVISKTLSGLSRVPVNDKLPAERPQAAAANKHTTATPCGGEEVCGQRKQ